MNEEKTPELLIKKSYGALINKVIKWILEFHKQPILRKMSK
jgi:hypothetical protein